MEKRFLKRPLAALLSLLMVISMFTVCGIAMAETKINDYTLQTWDVDALDAAAQATGTKNHVDSPIYHKTDKVIGFEKDSEGWLFHTQGFTNEAEGHPNHKFDKGDTLRVVMYLKGDLGAAGAWGRVDMAYNGGAAEINKSVEFTPDVIAQMTDADDSWLDGVVDGVKVFTQEFKLEEDGYDIAGQLLQLRVWVNGGAKLACYKAEIFNVTKDTVIYGVTPDRMGDGAAAGTAVPVTIPALASYCSQSVVIGNVPEQDRVYTSDCDGSTNAGANAVLLNGLGRTLPAGNYALDMNLATRFGLGEEKITFNFYSGSTKISTKTVTHSEWVNTLKLFPESGQMRTLRVPFTVAPEYADTEITYEIVLHNSTFSWFSGAELHALIPADQEMPALAEWSEKDIYNASDRSTVGASYEPKGEPDIIGIEANGQTEPGLTWSVDGLVVNTSLIANHNIRMTYKYFSPGMAGAI